MDGLWVLMGGPFKMVTLIPNFCIKYINLWPILFHMYYKYNGRGSKEHNNWCIALQRNSSVQKVWQQTVNSWGRQRSINSCEITLPADIKPPPLQTKSSHHGHVQCAAGEAAENVHLEGRFHTDKHTGNQWILSRLVLGQTQFSTL